MRQVAQGVLPAGNRRFDAREGGQYRDVSASSPCRAFACLDRGAVGENLCRLRQIRVRTPSRALRGRRDGASSLEAVTENRRRIVGTGEASRPLPRVAREREAGSHDASRLPRLPSPRLQTAFGLVIQSRSQKRPHLAAPSVRSNRSLLLHGQMRNRAAMLPAYCPATAPQGFVRRAAPALTRVAGPQAHAAPTQISVGAPRMSCVLEVVGGERDVPCQRDSSSGRLSVSKLALMTVLPPS